MSIIFNILMCRIIYTNYIVKYIMHAFYSKLQNGRIIENKFLKLFILSEKQNIKVFKLY